MHRTSARNRSTDRRGIGGMGAIGAGGLCAVLAVLLAAPASAIPVEPLTIRVSKTVGAPGGATAIVFRTYASRPVRRGRLSFAGSGLSALGGGPIASVQAVEFYSPDGPVAATAIDFNAATQALEVDFDHDVSFFNVNDGVLGAIFVTLDAGAVPGSEFPLNLDPTATFATDPEDDSHPLHLRGGELDVRSPSAPRDLEVDGGEVHPGSGALVEVGTSEPFAVEAAEIVVQYEPSHFFGPPTATTDPRHGQGALTVTYPAANRVKIRIDSADDSFNRVPGDVVRLHFSTRPTIPLGTLSVLQIVTADSWVQGPSATPIDVAWADQGIVFASDPPIFADGFDSGDAWLWSAVAP